MIQRASTETIAGVTEDTEFFLNCLNGGGNDIDSFAVRILSVALTANPDSGGKPLSTVDLFALVGGVSGGTYRYFFNCNNGILASDSLDIFTNQYAMSTPPISDFCGYASLGTYNPSIIVWHSQGIANALGTVTVTNSPPTVSDPSADVDTAFSFPCVSDVTFSWIFDDPEDGSTQSDFELQVNNNASFTAGLPLGVDIQGSVVAPPPASTQSKTIDISVTPGVNELGFNTTYWWRVRVQDADGAWSAWATPASVSFNTPLHASPTCNFTWAPNEPSAGEAARFTDLSIPDFAADPSLTITDWSWTFHSRIFRKFRRSRYSQLQLMNSLWP